MAGRNSKSVSENILENIIDRNNFPRISPFGVFLQCMKCKFERETGQKFHQYMNIDVEKIWLVIIFLFAIVHFSLFFEM